MEFQSGKIKGEGAGEIRKRCSQLWSGEIRGIECEGNEGGKRQREC